MNKVTVADRITIGDGKLALIGGPCMAESLAVCMETAGFLVELCGKLNIQYIFKASYDKANRSSGTSRRGPGRKAGLEFLAAVKERYNIPVLTDVHESGEVPEVAQVADVAHIVIVAEENGGGVAHAQRIIVADRVMDKMVVAALHQRNGVLPAVGHHVVVGLHPVAASEEPDAG